MNITAQQYSGQSFMEQFATRFLIKETLTHMAHLKQPLESALEKLEEQATVFIDVACKTTPFPN